MKKRPASSVRHLPARPSAELSTRCQFGQFMELLTRRRFAPKASLDGSPVGFWHGFPVEEAVTNGLMLVILDIAKKEDRPVATSDDVVAIARRIDRLVNAGLSVGYSNSESAAESFVRKVVLPVHRAALAGYRPDDPPPMSVWKEIVAGRPVTGPKARASQASEPGGEIGMFLGRPAALFFVRIINGALRHGARIQALLSDLERYNRLRSPVTWIPDSELDFARRALRLLDAPVERTIPFGKGGGNDSPYAISGAWGGWLETGAAVAALRQRIAAIRRWPVRLHAIPHGMEPTSVEEGWVETVVLMAIGRVKSDTDTLSLPAFWKSISMYGETCRGEKGTRPLRERVIKTLKSRDRTLGADALDTLSASIDLALGKIGVAFDAYEKMVSEMSAVESEMSGLSVLIRKIDARLAKAKKGKDGILDERELAADRLARLQELHDQAKSEFRANHFPAIFMPETAPEDALSGSGCR